MESDDVTAIAIATAPTDTTAEVAASNGSVMETRMEAARRATAIVTAEIDATTETAATAGIDGSLSGMEMETAMEVPDITMETPLISNNNTARVTSDGNDAKIETQTAGNAAMEIEQVTNTSRETNTQMETDKNATAIDTLVDTPIAKVHSNTRGRRSAPPPTAPITDVSTSTTPTPTTTAITTATSATTTTAMNTSNIPKNVIGHTTTENDEIVQNNNNNTKSPRSTTEPKAEPLPIVSALFAFSLLPCTFLFPYTLAASFMYLYDPLPSECPLNPHLFLLSTIALSYWFMGFHFCTVLPIFYIPFYLRLLWFITCIAGFGYAFFYGWVTLLNPDIIPTTCSDSVTFKVCFAGLASITLIAIWIILTSFGTQIHIWVWCCMTGREDERERTQHEAAWAAARGDIRHIRVKSDVYQITHQN